MRHNGTDPNTGYIVWIYEPGDIEVGDRIKTRDDYSMSVKRVTDRHIVCHSWPEDVALTYRDIKSVEHANPWTDRVQRVLA